MGQKIIEVSNLSKSFKEVNALKDINLNIDEPSLFGLIGPDGAGKTTLLRIITTLLLPDTGSVKIKTLDVVKNYKYIRRG